MNDISLPERLTITRKRIREILSVLVLCAVIGVMAAGLYTSVTGPSEPI